MSKKYNIIGDIHGRTNWKELVLPDAINIFVGDYFSPYEDEGINFTKASNNWCELLKYKDEHPETILLIGNHDEDHWHIRERYSRFDMSHVNIISQLFEDDKDKFQAAYSIENRFLVTHAGVTSEWFNSYATDEEKQQELTPDFLAEYINKKYLNGKETKYIEFRFDTNMSYFGDTYGESPTQSPFWVRPITLMECNIFKDKPEFKQIVGHTQVKNIFIDSEKVPLYLVDVLRNNTQSLVIEFDDENNTTLYVNKKE